MNQKSRFRISLHDFEIISLLIHSLKIYPKNKRLVQNNLTKNSKRSFIFTELLKTFGKKLCFCELF